MMPRSIPVVFLPPEREREIDERGMLQPGPVVTLRYATQGEVVEVVFVWLGLAVEINE